MKFFVMRGYEQSPGTKTCRYCVYDVVDLDPMKDIQEEMRKYSYRVFYEMGAPAKSMRETVYASKKNMNLGDSSVFADEVDVFYHTHTFLMFVPSSVFIKWSA